MFAPDDPAASASIVHAWIPPELAPVFGYAPEYRFPPLRCRPIGARTESMPVDDGPSRRVSALCTWQPCECGCEESGGPVPSWRGVRRVLLLRRVRVSDAVAAAAAARVSDPPTRMREVAVAAGETEETGGERPRSVTSCRWYRPP